MFLPYAVEDNIERKKNWVKCCLKWKFKYYLNVSISAIKEKFI